MTGRERGRRKNNFLLQLTTTRTGLIRNLTRLIHTLFAQSRSKGQTGRNERGREWRRDRGQGYVRGWGRKRGQQRKRGRGRERQRKQGKERTRESRHGNGEGGHATRRGYGGRSRHESGHENGEGEREGGREGGARARVSATS